MWWPRLAHQADLSSKSSGSGILQQARHSVVVQVIDEIPDTCLVGRSQLICSKRWQRRACGPRRAPFITVTRKTQGQQWLKRVEFWKVGNINMHSNSLFSFRLITLLSCSFPSAISSLTASSAASWRAAFLLGADDSANKFSPTFTLYLNLRRKKKEIFFCLVSN